MKELLQFFESGQVNEGDLGSSNETHITATLDESQRIWFQDGNEVRRSDILSRGNEITGLVRLHGAINVYIAPAFMIFWRKKRNYINHSVTNNGSDACFRLYAECVMNQIGMW